MKKHKPQILSAVCQCLWESLSKKLSEGQWSNQGFTAIVQHADCSHLPLVTSWLIPATEISALPIGLLFSSYTMPFIPWCTYNKGNNNILVLFYFHPLFCSLPFVSLMPEKIWITITNIHSGAWCMPTACMHLLVCEFEVHWDSGAELWALCSFFTFLPAQCMKSVPLCCPATLWVKMMQEGTYHSSAPEWSQSSWCTGSWNPACL